MSRSTSRAHGRPATLPVPEGTARRTAPGVELPERADVLARPRLSPIDLHVDDARLAKAVMTHRHRQPLRAGLRLDAIAIAPPVLVVLHVIVIDKHVGAPHLIEETQPRQVARLQDDEGLNAVAGASVAAHRLSDGQPLRSIGRDGRRPQPQHETDHAGHEQMRRTAGARWRRRLPRDAQRREQPHMQLLAHAEAIQGDRHVAQHGGRRHDGEQRRERRQRNRVLSRGTRDRPASGRRSRSHGGIACPRTAGVQRRRHVEPELLRMRRQRHGARPERRQPSRQPSGPDQRERDDQHETGGDAGHRESPHASQAGRLAGTNPGRGGREQWPGCRARARDRRSPRRRRRDSRAARPM